MRESGNAGGQVGGGEGGRDAQYTASRSCRPKSRTTSMEKGLQAARAASAASAEGMPPRGVRSVAGERAEKHYWRK